MSRTNIADDTFGDISRFKMDISTLQTSYENESGEQMDLINAKFARDNVTGVDDKRSHFEIESELENWSGPDTISDPESWGASESSKDDTNVNIKSSQVIKEGEATDSGSSLAIYEEENLADANFEEDNLVDEITVTADILPAENFNNENNNLVDESIDNANNNTTMCSIYDGDTYTFSNEPNSFIGDSFDIADVNYDMAIGTVSDLREGLNNGDQIPNTNKSKDKIISSIELNETNNSTLDGDGKHYLEGQYHFDRRDIWIDRDGMEDGNRSDAENSWDEESCSESGKNSENVNNLEDGNKLDSGNNLEDGNNLDGEKNPEGGNNLKGGNNSEEGKNSEGGNNSEDGNNLEDGNNVEGENNSEDIINLEDRNNLEGENKLEGENNLDGENNSEGGISLENGNNLEGENNSEVGNNSEDGNKLEGIDNFEGGDNSEGGNNLEGIDNFEGGDNSEGGNNLEGENSSPLSSRRTSVQNNVVIQMNLGDDGSLDVRNEADSKGYTVLEVWSILAMSVGAMSYSIWNDGSRSEVYRPAISKILWYFSLVLHAIEVVNVIPSISSLLDLDPSAVSFMYLGACLAYAFFRITLIRTVIFKEQYLVRANNCLILFSNAKMEKWKSGILLCTLFAICISNVCVYTVYQTEHATDFADFKLKDILDELECRGKSPLTLSNICTPSISFSLQSVVWGFLGFIIMTHELLMGMIVVLGITVSCAAVLFSTMSILKSDVVEEGNEYEHITHIDFTNINNLAEELSKFIGEALLAYLLVHGLELPMELNQIFTGTSTARASILLNYGIIFIALFFGSLGSLKVNIIADALSSQNNPTSRPVGSAMVRDFIREFLFRKTTGVGLPGLFVINFKIAFSYITVVGTLYTLYPQSS